MLVRKDRDGFKATLIARNGEKRPAAITVEGKTVTLRFELDNAPDPVRVVMTGSVDGDRTKGTADFGGRGFSD